MQKKHTSCQSELPESEILVIAILQNSLDALFLVLRVHRPRFEFAVLLFQSLERRAERLGNSRADADMPMGSICF
jgi:hypothetical protein